MGPEPNARTRFGFRIGLRSVLVIATVGPMLIWLVVGAIWKPAKYYSWDELRRSHYGDWLEVVAEPVGNGPFRYLGATSAGSGDPVSGTWYGNGRLTKYYVPGNPSDEYIVVGLLPRNGSPPTYAICRIRHSAVETHNSANTGQKLGSSH